MRKKEWARARFGRLLLALILPAQAVSRRCRAGVLRTSGARKKKGKKRKRSFAQNPLGSGVIPKTFRAVTLVIYLEHLSSSKNREKIYVGF